MKLKTANNWWESGVQTGWIETYEQEAVRFLKQEYGELSETEILCTVFTSLFLKAGHTTLPLNLSPNEWAGHLGMDIEESIFLSGEPIHISKLKNSKIIAVDGELKPLVLNQNRLSFQKQWKQENDVLQWFTDRQKSFSVPLVASTHNELLKHLFKQSSENPDWQKAAVGLSHIKPYLIISGGPGTGKTTTVARILAYQQQLAERPLHIALAAPTGKAAGRMGEALFRELEMMDLTDEELVHFPKEAKTVHRLLSGTEERGLLPPVEKKVLPHDLIIIDEASMIDLNLMHRLLSHLSESTRLILLGDKDQLASVEAGSVFADLCQKPANSFSPKTKKLLQQLGVEGNLPESDLDGIDDSIVYLTKSYRFGPDSGIGTLAESVKKGKAEINDISDLLKEFDDLEYSDFEYKKEDITRLVDTVIGRLQKTSGFSTAEELLGYWKETGWLTVLRRGLTGSDRLNRLVETQIATRRLVKVEDGWYHGRPIIITQNDYNLGVFNGDLGVCLNDNGKYWVYVESGSEIKRINPGRLTNYNPAYFLTVHKSQGSEFNRVDLLLPQKDTPILTRELIYTAITRARKKFSLKGSLELFKKGISRKTERFTGLQKNN